MLLYFLLTNIYPLCYNCYTPAEVEIYVEIVMVCVRVCMCVSLRTCLNMCTYRHTDIFVFF